MTGQERKKFPETPWPAFLVVATGVLLSTMDSSMVNLALPSIMAEFHSSLRHTEWVIAGYLLVITATLLLWGAIADRRGRRRTYVGGLLSFAGGAVFCSRAPDLTLLIVFRLLQATGAAMMMATGPAIIREVFPRDRLGKAYGLIGIAVSLGLMSGPSVGGLLLQIGSWRNLFLLPAFLALCAAAAALRVVPDGVRYRQEAGFDYLGGFFWAAGLAVLVGTLTYASSPTRSPLYASLGLLLASACFASFLVVERRSPTPLLLLDLIVERYYWTAVVCSSCSFIMLFTVTMLMPFYLDRVVRLPAMAIGLTMMAVPVAAVAAAPLSGSLSDRIGCRLLTTAGLLVSSLGLVLLAVFALGGSVPAAGFCLLLIGGGQATFLSPNSSSLLGRVPAAATAASAAVLATARNLGMLMGIGLSGLLFSAFFGRMTGGLDLRDFSGVHQPAFLYAMRWTLLSAAAIGMGAAWLSWGREKGSQGEREPGPIPD
ncbi:MAG: MFS transporter [Thermodesulfobacteriota bacterium]